MQLAIILSFIFVAGVLCEQYTDKYDNIDLDAIIKNDRLLKNYVDCLLDRGKCTNEGAELKKRLRDALETECAKCSERQKGGIRRVIKYLVENKKDWWNDLVLKYDPDGVYRRRYDQMSKNENINL